MHYQQQDTLKKKNYEPYFYNGIDRVDSSLGYVPDNVRPCCKKCNYMKNQMELKEFHEQVRKIHNVTKNKSGSN